MLIFNGKEMPSKYTVSDNMILEVNSNNTLDEIYEAIVFGGNIAEMVNVNAYKNGDGKVVLESDNMPSHAEIDGVRIGAPVLERSEAIESLEERISSKINERNPMFKAFESFTYGNAFDGYDIKPVNFNKNNPQHVEVLRKHIALARGVMPTLYDLKDENGKLKFKNLGRMRKLSMDGDNLVRYFGPGSVAEDNPLPTLEEINEFQKLSEYEKRTLTNSEVHPAKLMELKRELTQATNSKSAVITKDLIEHSNFSNAKVFDMDKKRIPGLEDDSMKSLMLSYSDAFKSQIGRPPQILAEYVYGIVLAEGEQSARDNVLKYTTKDYFSLKTMQAVIQSTTIEGSEKPFVTTVASTRNPGFIYLANKLGAVNYPQQLMRYLAHYVDNSNIGNLMKIGFDKWIEKNKNTKMSDLDNLFAAGVIDKLAAKGKVLDTNKSLKDNCFLVFNEKALSDMRSYEGKYHYKFEDNETAIKGRHICITEGNNKIYMLPDDDMRHFTVAATENTHCCQHWGGAGEACVAKYTSDPFASCVVVEDKNGQIQAQGFVWVDVNNDCFVFDNIEYHRDPNAKEYTNLIMAYCNELPYKNVQIGMGFVESSGSAWGGVGKPIGSVKAAPKAVMPTTVKNNHTYSDYHPTGTSGSAARVVKQDGVLVNYSLDTSRLRIENAEDEPSRWDILSEGPLKFLINDCSLSLEDRVRFAREFLENPTVEAQKAVFANNPEAILLVENPAEECQLEMYEKHPDVAMKISNPCTQLQSLIIVDHPEYICRIQNPDAELVRSVLSKKGLLLEKIQNPTEEMCLVAVENDGYALSRVPEELKTPRVVEAAINQAPKVATLYTDQSPEVQAIAARKLPDVVLMFKNPTVQAQMIAVSRKPSLVLQMKDVEEPVARVAVERAPSLISRFQFAFPELKMAAIERNPLVVRDIKNLTMEEYQRAVSLDPSVSRLVNIPASGNQGVSLGNDLDDLDIG